MASNFDKQLEKLLKQDPNELIDGLEDEGQEEEQPQEDMVPVVYEERESRVDVANPDLKDDYVSARSNLYGLLGDTNSAIKLAMRVAAMSEHPRALEVVSGLIKTSADISKEMIAIHKSLENKTGNQGNTGESGGSYTQINNYNYDKKEAESIVDSLDDDESKDE